MKTNPPRSRVLAWVMCLVMVLSLLPMSVFAIEDDWQPPEAKNVAVDRVEVLDSGEKKLYVTFDVTDTEGDTLIAGNCYMGICVEGFHDPEGVEGISFESIEQQSDGSYLGVLPLSPTWYGDFELRHIWLCDSNYNGEEYMLEGVTGTIPRVYDEAYSLGDLTFRPEGVQTPGTGDLTVTLNAAQPSCILEVKAPLTIAQGVEEPSYIFEIRFADENGNNLWAFGGRELDGQVRFEVGLHFGGQEEGTYTVRQVFYNGREVPFGSAPALTIVKDNGGDEQGPVLEDIYFTVNGERAQAGFSIDETDTLKLCVKLTDATGVKDVSFVLFHVSESGGSYFEMTDDDGDGLVETEILPADMPSTGLYCVKDLSARDVFDSWRHFNVENTCYFTKAGQGGGSEIPKVYADVLFRIPDVNEWHVGGEFNAVTDLDEILAEAERQGCAIPTPEMEDAAFLGWYDRSSGQVYTGQETILLTGGSVLELYPKFDKTKVNVTANYADENGNRNFFSVPYLAQDGDTVADLLAGLEAGVEHYAGLTFTGWSAVGYDEDQVLDASVTHLSVEAVYEELLVYLSYSFVDEYGSNSNSVIVIMENGATVADLKERFLTETAPSVEHNADLGQVTWSCGWEDTEKLYSGCDVWFEAAYEKTPVTIEILYWDAEGRRAYESVDVVLDADEATFGKVIERFEELAAGLEHYSGLGEPTGWEGYAYGNDPDETVSAGEWIYFSARYAKTAVRYECSYYNEKNEYCWNDGMIVMEPDEATYAAATAAVMEKLNGLTHTEVLGELVKWEKFFGYENENDLVYDGEVLGFGAVYTKIPVTVEIKYISDDGVTYEDILAAVEEGDTYQDVYDTLELDLEHKSGYTLVKWEYDGDLTATVDPSGGYMSVEAVYESYKVPVSCSYLGDDGKVVTVTTTVELEHGEDILAYIKSIPVPGHALADEFMGWAVADHKVDSPEAGVGTEEIWLAARYESLLPVYVKVPYVGPDLTPETLEELRYIEHTGTDEEQLLETMNVYLEKLFEEITGLMDPALNFNGEDFEPYVASLGGIEGVGEDGSGLGIYAMTWLEFIPMTQKTLLVITYPDGTVEKLQVESGEEFELPETAEGKDLVWAVVHALFDEGEAEGGEIVYTISPWITMAGSYADGSEYVPEPTPTPTPEPTPAPSAKPQVTPAPGGTPAPEASPEATPEVEPSEKPQESQKPEVTPEATPEPTPEVTPEVPGDGQDDEPGDKGGFAWWIIPAAVVVVAAVVLLIVLGRKKKA